MRGVGRAKKRAKKMAGNGMENRVLSGAPWGGARVGVGQDAWVDVRWRMVWCGLALLAFGIVFTLSVSNIESLYEDDFYYYLVVARHFVSGFGTSYYRDLLTNGYQPLWQFVVILAAYVGSVVGWSPLTLVYAFGALFGLGSVALVLRAGKQLSSEGALAVVFCSGMLYSFLNMGMEIPALIFFSVVLILHVGRGGQGAVLIGLALFGCFLSRIDSLVYWVPVVSYLLWGSRRVLVRSLLLLAVLIAIYGAVNKFYFGIWMPVSGLAKNSPGFSFHAQTFVSLLLEPRPSVYVLWCVFITPVLYVLLPAKRPIILISSCLVLAYYVLHSFRSDYRIWAWYLYPFLLHVLTIGLVEVESGAAGKRGLGITLLLFGTLFIAGGMVFSKLVAQYKTRQQDNDMIAVGKFVANVAAVNGIKVIAMGDRAGAVGYASGAAVVQLEGLVMDKGYLDRHGRRLNLLAALQQYKADAYVATSPVAMSGEGCYMVAEPEQARDRMVPTRVCMPVLATHQMPGGLLTVVFKVPKVHVAEGE
jgi:hypothetical protein